ncbi:hypothetical protein PN836_012620 [Ningiella sp. W23]|uniref:hypothetical protein n=1 Tax=Ningiella sp. W23 TaxID=3023715 RepID=UPI00375817D9
MILRKKMVICCCAISLVAACSLTQSEESAYLGDGTHMNNARLLGASEQSINAIEEAIATMLNTEKVNLSKAVFSDSSELIVGPNTVSDTHGNIRSGNDTSGFDLSTGELVGVGDRFYLKLHKGACYILHEQSGALMKLDELQCEVE